MCIRDSFHTGCGQPLGLGCGAARHQLLLDWAVVRRVTRQLLPGVGQRLAGQQQCGAAFAVPHIRGDDQRITAAPLLVGVTDGGDQAIVHEFHPAPAAARLATQPKLSLKHTLMCIRDRFIYARLH